MIVGWLALAVAAAPLPDYGRELARARWHLANQELDDGCRFDAAGAGVACEPGATERARALATAWMDQVRPDAGLWYLVGLSWRYEGDQRKAIHAYERSLELDPEYDAAWYDAGEVYLILGRFDDAAIAFERVAALRVEGESAWLGPWRRAEVAAHQHDAATFDQWMHEALRRGFSFRQIKGSPPWRAFYADPALQDAIEKLLTVYATPDVLESLRP